jgi:ABC-type transporter Mla MlaB component
MKQLALPPLQRAPRGNWRQAVTVGLGYGRDEWKSGPWRGSAWESTALAADLDYDIQEGVLYIRIRGPLDLRCIFQLIAIGKTADEGITSCVLDLTGVNKVFDSGVAALILLARELTERGIGRIHIQEPDLNRTALSPYINGVNPFVLTQGLRSVIPGNFRHRSYGDANRGEDKNPWNMSDTIQPGNSGGQGSSVRSCRRSAGSTGLTK